MIKYENSPKYYFLVVVVGVVGGGGGGGGGRVIEENSPKHFFLGGRGGGRGSGADGLGVYRKNFLRIQKLVRISHGKRTICVRAIEIRLYHIQLLVHFLTSASSWKKTF